MVSIRAMISSFRSCCCSWLWRFDNEIAQNAAEDKEEELVKDEVKDDNDNANIDIDDARSSGESEIVDLAGADEDGDGSFTADSDSDEEVDVIVNASESRMNPATVCYSKPFVLCHELDGEILRQLERDDPDIAGLFVNGFDFWVEGAGRIIGGNTRLKVLLIVIDNDVGEDSWLDELCRELSHNRSIECLEIHVRCQLQLRLDTFRILAPFLERNSQLRCITLSHNHPQSQTFNSMVSVLSNCKIGRLECIEVFCCVTGIDDEQSAEFFEALSHHCYLSKLAYGGPVERMGSKALANVLKSSSPNLVELRLIPSHVMDDLCVAIIVDAMIQNRTLISIEICENTMEKAGWAIFCGYIFRSMTLECLRLDNIHMFVFELTCVTQALAASQSIKQLDLNGITSLSPRAWRKFSKWLTSPCVTITALSLAGCTINTRELLAIIRSLSVNTSISKLNLGEITSELTSECWKSISRLLCDATNIDNTYSSSNHTLYTLILPDHWSDVDEAILGEIASLLYLNETENKAAVARRKVIDIHFAGEVTANHPLAGLPETNLPHILSWLGRDELGFSALYFAVHGFYGGWPKASPKFTPDDEDAKSVSSGTKERTISISIICAQTDEKITFSMFESAKMSDLFQAYAQRQGIVDLSSLRFFLDQDRINDTDTLNELELETGDEIECFRIE
ncbi:hypothetical protein ACHAWU_002304 [Discostella pseudostelligera]|uniref:Rad60/SUMO-like domain-containing protein n=1 Tax=Discostella pseudostelligera TaxID=259834 RepID=A0ABD3MRA8_9STRA